MSEETQIVLSSQPGFWLSKPGDDSDTSYRISLFQKWLLEREETWFNCHLAEFRDELLQRGYASSSVSAIMGTLRQRIRSFTHDNDFAHWYRQVQKSMGLSWEQSELSLTAMLRQISNIADARNSPVHQKTIQDETDEQRLWINGSEDELLEAIFQDRHPNIALRDRAMIALFLATGIRREELVNLQAIDLSQPYRGRRALLVRHGKGDKQRLVIYGDLWEKYVQPYVLPWLNWIQSEQAPLFQGFWRGNQKLRGRKLHVSSVNEIVASEPVIIDGSRFSISPHDLRRTYARSLFQDYGMSIEGIQEQMGHNDIKTTRLYIGALDLNFRTPILKDK